MKKRKVLNKAVGFVFCGMLCLSMPMQVGAAEFAGSVSDSDIVQDIDVETDTDTVLQTAVPDTTGMAIEDARQMLAEQGEPVVEYVYSDNVDMDVVMRQEEEDGQIHLTVSLGAEPQEDLYTSGETVDKLGSFGLSAYTASSPIVIDGNFDDWTDIPCSYEFNWDNSHACWYDGVWEETVGMEGYKTPVGTYDDNVRHKVCFYVDGEYAYLYVRFAKSYTARFQGYDYRFYDSTGQYAQFNLTDLEGKTIRVGSEKFQPGVYEISVKNGGGWESPEPVRGAKAYLKINDDYMKAELELKIPLSEMVAQNSHMSMEHMDIMQWDNPNLTYRRVTAAGAGTAPFVAAGIALAGVFGGMLFLGKKGMKQQKKEQ